MSYTTVAKVRTECGLTDNANILDAEIQSYIDEAEAKLKSYVAGRYLITNLVASADFTGSQAEDMLDLIEKLIASGLLLNALNPGYENDTERTGNVKISRGDTMLEEILSGKIKLLKANGTEFALTPKNSSGGYVYQPAISDTDDDFKISDIF